MNKFIRQALQSNWLCPILILAAIAILLGVVAIRKAQAEPIIKAGAIHTLLDTSSAGPYIEAAYEFHPTKHLGIEPSLAYFTSILHGEDITGNWAPRGTLHVFPTILNIKYHAGHYYIGAGTGIAWQAFSERHASVKPRIMAAGIAGAELTQSWGIEIKALFADLNIESGVPEYGIMEDKSNLKSITIAVTRRF